MATTLFFIFTIGICSFIVRSRAIKSKKLSLGYFKIHNSTQYEVPEQVIRFGRHFDNQFQVPLLFLITLIVCQITAPESQLLFVLSWLFLLSRCVHSWIHLGTNNVLRRAQFYLVGWILLMMMWIVLLVENQSV